MSNITVWTTPNCNQCKQTIRFFEKDGISPRINDLSAPENLDKLKEIKAAGHHQAPYVETPTDAWSGLRPDKIVQAVSQERQATPNPSLQSPTHTRDMST